MSHFVSCKTTAPAGDWTGVTIVDPSWLTTMDGQLFKAINGDDGGTWAPSSSIIVGGSGLLVSGLFQGANIGSSTLNGTLTVSGSGSIVAATGTTSTWQSGSTFTASTGSHVNISGVLTLTTQAGSAITIDLDSSLELDGTNTFGVASTTTVQGTFRFDPSQPPNFSSAITIQRSGLLFAGATARDGSAPVGVGSVNWCAWMGAQLTSPPRPIVTTDAASVVGCSYWLDLPQPVDGATLTHVYISLAGTGTPTTYPTFSVVRIALATGVIDALGTLVTDGLGAYSATRHDLDHVCSTNNVIDLATYRYAVKCTPPVGGGQQLVFNTRGVYQSTRVAN